jgi:hypothetical protein
MNTMINRENYFANKLKFQTSSDGSTWADEFIVDSNIHEGWNEYIPATALEYQYYRFFSTTKYAWQIGEIELIGNIVEISNAVSKECTISLKDSATQQQDFGTTITYKDTATPVVTQISPRYVSYKGGEDITFTGSNFSTVTSEIKISLNGIDCPIQTATATEIVWETIARNSISSSPVTILSFSGSGKFGYAAMQELDTKYANYWSDPETWTGKIAPEKGRSVSISKEQTVIYDVDSSPVLDTITIEGGLVFLPDADPDHQRSIDSNNIMIK